MLDLKLEHKLELLCDEAALASVFVWLQRRYEMMFSKFWKFKLEAENPRHPRMIGPRIRIENGDIIQLAAQYHGVQIMYHQLKKPEDILAVAARELAAGFPVAVMFHDDYLPEVKQSEWGKHNPAVITGMDDGGVYCLEVHSLKKVVYIPTADFLKGYQGCATFALLGDDLRHIDYRDVIWHNTGYLLENNSFDGMRELSGLMAELDYDVECNGQTNAPYVEISQQLKMLYRSRYLFSLTLAYLAGICQAEVLMKYSEQFSDLSAQWLSTWGSLTMAFRQKEFKVKRDFGSQMGRVSRKVHALAGVEEELCHLLEKTLG